MKTSVKVWYRASYDTSFVGAKALFYLLSGDMFTRARFLLSRLECSTTPLYWED